MPQSCAMSRMLALFLVFQLSSITHAAETIKSQITGMPAGTGIVVHLRNKETLRGAKGDTSDTGFTLVDPNLGNRQIAFDEISAVRQFAANPARKSHKTRNVLIIVGVALVVVVAVIAVHSKDCPLGCGNHAGY